MALLLIDGTGCRPPQPDLPADAVAEVGGRTITVAEVTEQLRRGGSSALRAGEEPDRRRSALDALIDEEALYQRARESGLDRDPEMIRRFRRLLVQEYRERSLGKEGDPIPTESDLRRWYDSHPDSFTEPAQVRGSLIALRLPPGVETERRAAVQARLGEAREAIASAADPAKAFAETARVVSEDPATRRQGGDTGWVVAGRLTRWPREVTGILFGPLPAGGLSPVIETPHGPYLVRIAERRPSRRRSFDEMKAALTTRVGASLREERQRGLVAQARAATTIRENPAALAAVPLPHSTQVPTGTPPAVPGSPAAAASAASTQP